MKYHVKVCAVETQTLLQNTLFKRESRVLSPPLPSPPMLARKLHSRRNKDLKGCKKKRGVISDKETNSSLHIMQRSSKFRHYRHGPAHFFFFFFFAVHICGYEGSFYTAQMLSLSHTHTHTRTLRKLHIETHKTRIYNQHLQQGEEVSIWSRATGSSGGRHLRQTGSLSPRVSGALSFFQ